MKRDVYKRIDSMNGKSKRSVTSAFFASAMRSHSASLCVLELGAIGDTVTKTTADGAALECASLGSARILYGLQERWNSIRRR